MTNCYFRSPITKINPENSPLLVQRVPVLYSLLTRPERETIGKKNLDSLIVPLNGLECILRILTTGVQYRKVISSNHIRDFRFFSYCPHDKLINMSSLFGSFTFTIVSFLSVQCSVLLLNYFLDPVSVNNPPALSQILFLPEGI